MPAVNELLSVCLFWTWGSGGAGVSFCCVVLAVVDFEVFSVSSGSMASFSIDCNLLSSPTTSCQSDAEVETITIYQP